MMNITVNSKNATIELTKTFAAKAKYYGSEEYKQLQNVRRDYPDYRVITRTTKSADHMKGFNSKKMYDYILNHENTNRETILDEFCELAGWDKKKGKRDPKKQTLTIGELKLWFFDTYPEVKEVKEKHDEKVSSIMERVRKNQEAKRMAS